MPYFNINKLKKLTSIAVAIALLLVLLTKPLTYWFYSPVNAADTQTCAKEDLRWLHTDGRKTNEII